jgi:hypothetical protein
MTDDLVTTFHFRTLKFASRMKEYLGSCFMILEASMHISEEPALPKTSS